MSILPRGAGHDLDADRPTTIRPGSLRTYLRPDNIGAARSVKEEGPASRPVLPRFVVDGVDYGLEIVPPLVMVSADVSWQLAGMSRCAGFVLS